MFNKHLYNKFTRSQEQHIELREISEGSGNIDEANETTSIEELELEEEYNEEDEIGTPSLWNRFLDIVLNRTRTLRSKDGRHIPITLDHTTVEYLTYSCPNNDLLMDERLDKPYCDNQITSSRYTVFSFFPRQLYAQFSRLANSYFFLVAILQMIPGWSTTGTYTTIIPLCVFMGISMAREAWDDFKRHRLDKEENEKLVSVLTKTPLNNDALKEDDFSLNPQITGLGSVPDEIDSAARSTTSQGPLYTQFNNFQLLADRHRVSIEKRQWKNIRVGDFVLLKQDDWVPADLLLLASDGSNSECFVETMALDGETNLKSRQPHLELSKLTCAASGLANINARVTIEDPNIDLYNFEGNLELHGHQNDSFIKFPLSTDNVIYRGSILRNTHNAVGMVIFTGEETKIRMNALKNPRIKAPKLQRKINMIVAFMVFVVATVSLFSYLGHVLDNKKFLNDGQAWYLMNQDAGVAATIMSFIIMYNTMIPLSLYVTMEIIKVIQSKLMEWDIDMYHAETNTPCESRTATILEELGQVSYIFGDKTGTLTDNKMIFRKFSFCGSSWVHNVSSEDNLLNKQQSNISETNLDVVSYDGGELLDNLRHEEVQAGPSSVNVGNSARRSVDYKGNSAATYTGRPSMRSLRGERSFSSEASSTARKRGGPPALKSSFDLIKYIQKHPDELFSQKAKFFILSLALCHSCLAKKSDGSTQEDDAVEYQSSSPDELALVTAARDLGYIVLGRNAKFLTIKSYPNGFDAEPQTDDYEILNYIDFNSQRKRMSVLVRMADHPDKVLLICKGADSIILERLRNRDFAYQKLDEINTNTKERKDAEAELIIQKRLSLERMAATDDVISNRLRPSVSSNPRESLSLKAVRKSMSKKGNNHQDPEMQIESIDQFLDNIKRTDDEIEDVIAHSRQSLHKQQLEKYSSRVSTDNGYRKAEIDFLRTSPTQTHFSSPDKTDMDQYIGSDELIQSEEYVLERTLQAIDEFSTEGLRTLLYAYKWIDSSEYAGWEERYHLAKTSLTDRKAKIDRIGAEIEDDLSLLGTTAIEDKLQEGVGESIEKIRRAGIKMWMLTGDKRETAINIGYSCKLIYDYSTVVVFSTNEENMIAKMNAVTQEIDSGNVAHCVLVIDGATVALFESNPNLMSVFIELCTKTDSVICCRASPSQKALMVSNIRNTDKSLVTLAIGDGANDIAMIQSADIGVGIAGKEGLQASRSSDYSIGQFRFLIKLLFVHGRYNYIRTSKFVLCTFYKEVSFYLTQLIYQRYTMFSGTSLYESWSLSMFNTLFTSLPVLCIGMFEKDLKPATLLTVPELYSTGRTYQSFNFIVFFQWIIMGACNAVIVTFLNVTIWGETALTDNTLYPLGIINYTALTFLINIKCQFVETHNRNWLAFASVAISCLGWLLWCCLLPRVRKNDPIYDVEDGLYQYFGDDITFYCSILVLTVLPVMIDIIYKTVKVMIWPTDTDIFAQLEKKSGIRKKLEFGAYNEMKQGWTWERDPGTFQAYKDRVFPRSRASSRASSKNEGTSGGRSPSNTLSASDSDGTNTGQNEAENLSYDYDKYEMLPSGKLIKRKDLEPRPSQESSTKIATLIPKRLRFSLRSDSEDDADVRAIIEQRMQDLE